MLAYIDYAHSVIIMVAEPTSVKEIAKRLDLPFKISSRKLLKVLFDYDFSPGSKQYD